MQLKKIGNDFALKSWKMRLYLTQRMSKISASLLIFSSDMFNLQLNVTVELLIFGSYIFPTWKFISFLNVLYNFV